MTEITITPASAADVQALADLFVGHITAHPEYISHGEIQMGVGEGAQGENPVSRIGKNGAACSLRFLRFEKQA